MDPLAVLLSVSDPATALLSQTGADDSQSMHSSDSRRLRAFISQIFRANADVVLYAHGGGLTLVIFHNHPKVKDLLFTDVVFPRMDSPRFVDRLLATRLDNRAISRRDVLKTFFLLQKEKLHLSKNRSPQML